MATSLDKIFTLVHYGTMYGREGVDDDKGILQHAWFAIRKYIRENADLPVNITFINEGAEAIPASTDLTSI